MSPYVMVPALCRQQASTLLIFDALFAFAAACYYAIQMPIFFIDDFRFFFAKILIFAPFFRFSPPLMLPAMIALFHLR